jgi:predicted PurR-regulated permease PerM
MGLGRQAHQLFVLIAVDGLCGIRFIEIAKPDCGLPMDPREHIRVTGFALKNWAVAQVQDSIAVALLWLVGLWILKVPWALLWAGLAATLQIVPHLGPVLSLVGPVLAALLRWHDWEHPLFVLILYAVIVVVDGLLLQPYIMRRVAKVPMWASILVPIILGFAIPFWGFILAPPLLAVVYAYKARGTA